MLEISWMCRYGDWFVFPDESDPLWRRVWDVVAWWFEARVRNRHRCEEDHRTKEDE